MKPATGFELLELVGKSGLLEENAIRHWQGQCTQERSAEDVAQAMVEAGVLSDWHSGLLLRGKWKGFFVDEYCLWNLVESDTFRGIHLYNVIDKRTGSRLVMELVPPERARTKSDGLFYIVHDGGTSNSANPT